MLSSVRRIGKEEISAILEQCLEADIAAETPSLEVDECIIEQSRVKAMGLPVLPNWKASLAENLIIPTNGLSDLMVARLKSLATFPNPVFYEKQLQRFPTYNIPRYLYSGEDHSDHIVMPRGCVEDVVELFVECCSRLEIEDRRLNPKGIRVAFKGNLHPYQRMAQHKITEHEHGVLVAPPGSG